MTTSATPHLFWITSRAAGVLALVLASLAVSLGLLMSTKLLRRRGPDLLAVHEVLSVSAIVAIVDPRRRRCSATSYLNASLADIAVPFAFSYKTFWTSLGIITGWGMAILGLTYYARRWFGAARWRKLHRFTAVVWLAGLGHALGEGTDAGQPWFLAMIAILVVPSLALPAGPHGGSPHGRPPRAHSRRNGAATSAPCPTVRSPRPASPSAADPAGGG